MCRMLQTINSRHLDVLSIHCKYVDNLSNLQVHIQELLSLKFVAMRAMVKVNFADAMAPIELCRKSALRLTRELSEHFRAAESLADDDVDQFRETDEALASTLQRFLDSSDKDTCDAVKTFKAHLYKTVIDMETVKNALSNWVIRGAGTDEESDELCDGETPDCELGDVIADDDGDCQEEVSETMCQQHATVCSALPKDTPTNMSVSSKETSPCGSETGSSKDNIRPGFLHPIARFIEAQPLDPPAPTPQGTNVAQTMAEPIKSPEPSDGKSSLDWEAPGWVTIKPLTVFPSERSADGEREDDPAQKISPGGRYFCPIVVTDLGAEAQQSSNASDLEGTAKQENPRAVASTSIDSLLTGELRFSGMTLRTSADQDSCCESRATRSEGPFDLIDTDTLATMLAESGDALCNDSDGNFSSAFGATVIVCLTFAGLYFYIDKVYYMFYGVIIVVIIK